MKLLFDFLPIVVFFVAYKVAGIYWATGAAVAVSALQIAALRIGRRPVDRTQWFMWKPSLINWAFALAFAASLLGRMPLAERLLGGQLALPRAVWRRLTVGWVAFFLLSGALNAYVAFVYRVTPDRLDAEQQAVYQQVAADDARYVDAVEGKAWAQLAPEQQAAVAAIAPAQRQAAYLHKLHRDLWVDFKLFGLLGLTLAFALAQGVYLSRHLPPATAGGESAA
jgi:intracellular septation protein